MIYEKEITVEVDCDMKELKNILNLNNFTLKEEFDLIDYYFIKKDYDTNLDDLDILKQCVLIRNIIEEDKEQKLITYKYKEYDDNGDILKQGKVNCKIESVSEAQKLFEAMGYFKLLEIRDHVTVYANEVTEFAVQEVNNKHIYIEIEDKCNHINKLYTDVEEMKQDITKYSIPIKGDNYFVSKAVIELNECYHR